MLLKNKIKKWVSETLITQAQGEAILDYENTSKSGSSSWIVHGFLIVAVFSAGLGIIALIAANWRAIPAFFKLAGYFLLTAYVGFSALKAKLASQQKKHANVWFEPLLIFFMILCLAGIGLISQIYNIKGESYQAFFIWSVITCGLMALSRQSLTMYIWLTGINLAYIGWILDVYNDDIFFKAILLHPLLFFSCAMFFHNQKITKIFPALVLKRSVLEEWTIIIGFISLVFLHAVPQRALISLFELTLICLLGLMAFSAIAISAYKKIQKYLLACILFMFLFFYFMAFSIKLNSLALMIFSVLILALCGFFFATLKKINLFMLFVVALIFRILFFYIIVFKSLTLTGLILVFMGAIIVMVIQLVRKNKEKLMRWLEQLE